MADQDFQEEDVWGHVVKEREESSHKVKNKPYKLNKRTPSSSSSSSCCVWTSQEGARRMIPRSSNEGKVPVQQSSAPMGIPDWSKIYKGPSDDEEEDEGEMVPPHEYIARRLARSHITSSSMCEGVGRTLKGRDLSKLRNAILTKTGFLE